ncbi:hypothetical protein [Porphyromonas levii]|uniref:hypothetical protein n=1 Tax=Porphyromonas levii TaxID=28114 RepID=UPI001071482D|nr:hypothetical protein [Porphyromonas levii]MBR8758994.1 hypothetical protein [Porphyromonas levii]TFH95181.1 hypothetical protein E4P48_08570 [Porphyromonas levii]
MSTIIREGYHGTSVDNANNITNQGFVISKGYSHWLGDGVYFFVKGLCDPEHAACQWAIVNAWDNDNKTNKYEEYATLKVNINCDNSKVLDLTTCDGVEILDYIQERCINKIKKVKKEKNLKYVDGFLINFAREQLLIDLDIVISNMYIQLTKEQRIKRINRRTQNCTVCAVFDPGAYVNIVGVCKTDKVAL